MMAKLETKAERMVPLSKITPAKAAPYLCSRCYRPLPTRPLEYICEDCGAWHYKGYFYICCPADAERTF